MTESQYRPVPPTWRREIPQFISMWREKRAVDRSKSLDPIDYLDQDGGAEFAIAASWLFCPETIEYRDGIFLKRKFSGSNVDNWLSKADLVSTQATVNLTETWTLFDHVDSPVFDNLDELQLVSALGECWFGVIQQRHPRHEIFVSVDLDEDEDAPNGPSLTFWSGGLRSMG